MAMGMPDLSNKMRFARLARMVHGRYANGLQAKCSVSALRWGDEAHLSSEAFVWGAPWQVEHTARVHQPGVEAADVEDDEADLLGSQLGLS